ncbi:MAG: DUF4411 family protein [Candidatus Hydrogenedentota bacterium]
MIHAWDNYPPGQFPPLWRWMAREISAGQFVMPKVAFEEVDAHAPDCGQWLRRNHLKRIEVTNAIVQEALRIKGLLGIHGDNYHPAGVGENDILIVATALVEGLELVSNEGRQNNLPKNPAKRKIPAVCEMAGVGVPCLDFITLITRSGEVFDS